MAFVRGFRRLVAPLVEQLLAETWTACRGSDAVVYNALGGSFLYIGLHVAQALHVPYVGVSLWPASVTRGFPSSNPEA